MKILVADDSKLIVSLITSLLKSLDEQLNILFAYNGNEAVEITGKEIPDLILMDWQMPVMSGLDALKIIKDDANTRQIPVIMLTASENVSEAFKYGATDFIQKPFQKEEFITRVRNIITAINASKTSSIESEEKKLEKEWINLEIEKDKLKNFRETLIRQKKELTAVFGMAKSLHYRYFIDNSDLFSRFSDYFVFSLPLFDIPSNFVWARNFDNSVLIVTAIYERKGIQSFLISVALDKILGSINRIPENAAEFEKIHENILANIDKQLINSEIFFSFFNINFEKNILSLYGQFLPFYLLHDNNLNILTPQNDNGIDIPFSRNDILYFVRNGFYEDPEQNAHKESLFFEYFKNNVNIPFENQKQNIDQNVKNWTKELRQLNDILVLGIKI
jgi:CheY-like chemotaxis protein